MKRSILFKQVADKVIDALCQGEMTAFDFVIRNKKGNAVGSADGNVSCRDDFYPEYLLEEITICNSQREVLPLLTTAAHEYVETELEDLNLKALKAFNAYSSGYERQQYEQAMRGEYMS